MTRGSTECGRSVICFIGVGSNEGDSVSLCQEAVRRISSVDGIRFLRMSSLYKTEPVGLENQPWFTNCVVELKTTLDPRSLLNVLLTIESDMGRTRQIKWGPRTIDLDILLYGGCIIEEDGMVIPHPELHKRRFVLVPMNEIASYIVHPLFGISMKGLLDRLRDKSAVELLEYKTKDLRNGFLATKFESS